MTGTSLTLAKIESKRPSTVESLVAELLERPRDPDVIHAYVRYRQMTETRANAYNLLHPLRGHSHTTWSCDFIRAICEIEENPSKAFTDLLVLEESELRSPVLLYWQAQAAARCRLGKLARNRLRDAWKRDPSFLAPAIQLLTFGYQNWSRRGLLPVVDNLRELDYHVVESSIRNLPFDSCLVFVRLGWYFTLRGDNSVADAYLNDAFRIAAQLGEPAVQFLVGDCFASIGDLERALYCLRAAYSGNRFPSGRLSQRAVAALEGYTGKEKAVRGLALGVNAYLNGEHETAIEFSEEAFDFREAERVRKRYTALAANELETNEFAYQQFLQILSEDSEDLEVLEKLVRLHFRGGCGTAIAVTEKAFCCQSISQGSQSLLKSLVEISIKGVRSRDVIIRALKALAASEGMDEADLQVYRSWIDPPLSDGECAQIYETAFSAHPNDLQIGLHRARLLIKLQEHVSAKELLSQLIAQHQDNMEALKLSAIADQHIGNGVDAAMTLVKLLDREPLSADLFQLLTNVCHDLADASYVIQHIKEILPESNELSISINPAVRAYVCTLAEQENDADLWCFAGACLRAEEKHREALQALERSLSLDSEHGVAHFFFAETTCVQGNFADAVKHLQHAIRCESTRDRAELLMGELECGALNRRVQGVKRLEAMAIRTDNWDPLRLRAMARLVICYFEDGEEASARSMLERLRMHPLGGQQVSDLESVLTSVGDDQGDDASEIAYKDCEDGYLMCIGLASNYIPGSLLLGGVVIAREAGAKEGEDPSLFYIVKDTEGAHDDQVERRVRAFEERWESLRASRPILQNVRCEACKLTNLEEVLCSDGFRKFRALAGGKIVCDRSLLCSLKVIWRHRQAVVGDDSINAIGYLIGGSFVRGKFTRDSDIDVWIVFDDVNLQKDRLEGVRDEKMERVRVLYRELSGVNKARSMPLHFHVFGLAELWRAACNGAPLVTSFVGGSWELCGDKSLALLREFVETGVVIDKTLEINGRIKRGYRALGRCEEGLGFIARDELIEPIMELARATLMAYGHPAPPPVDVWPAFKSTFVDSGRWKADTGAAAALELILERRRDFKYGFRGVKAGAEIDELMHNARLVMPGFRKLFQDLDSPEVPRENGE